MAKQTFKAKIETAAGKEMGGAFITLPFDVEAELGAAACWKQLSYSCKREYATWIEEAKKAETRKRRITKAVALLAEGKRLR